MTPWSFRDQGFYQTVGSGALKIVRYCKAAAESGCLGQFLKCRVDLHMSFPHLLPSRKLRASKKKAALSVKNLSLGFDMLSDLFSMPAVRLIFLHSLQSNRTNLRLTRLVILARSVIERKVPRQD